MAEAAVYDQRRYTSVLLQHPALTDFASLAQALGAALARPKVLQLSPPNWRAERFEFLLSRNLYPEHRLDNSHHRKDGLHPHDMYFAARRPLESLGVPVVLLASPYVRLLSHVVKALQSELPRPAPKYLAIDMSSVYKAFSSDSHGMSATKVTLQILNQPGLELVSLSGKNPLHSELHAAIQEVAAPYAVRVDAGVGELHCRVNVDRHGNLWWYQYDESRFAMPLALVDRLDHLAAFRLTRSLPLDRAESQDEE